MSDLASPDKKIDENFRLVLIEGGATVSGTSGGYQSKRSDRVLANSEVAPDLSLLCRPFNISAEKTIPGILQSIVSVVDMERYEHHCECLLAAYFEQLFLRFNPCFSAAFDCIRQYESINEVFLSIMRVNQFNYSCHCINCSEKYKTRRKFK